MTRPPLTTKTKRLLALLGGVLSLCLFFVLLEGFASLMLAWSVPHKSLLTERTHCVYDPLLGWINESNVHVEDLYGQGLGLSTNARALRGRNDVTPTPAPGRFRILCLGDSFTLGHGVDDSATFPAWMERLHASLEAPNMGQGGYGVDQSYLWYRRDAADLEAQVVLLSFIAPDFERMLSERFQGQYPKPRLRVENGQLIYPSEPLPEDWTPTDKVLSRFTDNLSIVELFQQLQWERGGPRLTDTSYQPIAEAVLVDLEKLVQERGGRLVLAHIPVRDRNVGYTDAVLAWLKPLAQRIDVPLINLADEFAGFVPGEADSLYLPAGHMNASGNRRLAELLTARLRGLFPELPMSDL